MLMIVLVTSLASDNVVSPEKAVVPSYTMTNPWAKISQSYTTVYCENSNADFFYNGSPDSFWSDSNIYHRLQNPETIFIVSDSQRLYFCSNLTESSALGFHTQITNPESIYTRRCETANTVSPTALPTSAPSAPTAYSEFYFSNVNYEDYLTIPPLSTYSSLNGSQIVFLNGTGDENHNHIAVCDSGNAITAICGFPLADVNTDTLSLCPGNYSGPTYIQCYPYAVTAPSPPTSGLGMESRRTVLLHGTEIGNSVYNVTCNADELLVGICMSYQNVENSGFEEIEYDRECGELLVGNVRPDPQFVYLGFIICEAIPNLNSSITTSVSTTQTNYTYLECPQPNSFMSGICFKQSSEAYCVSHATGITQTPTNPPTPAPTAPPSVTPSANPTTIPTGAPTPLPRRTVFFNGFNASFQCQSNELMVGICLSYSSSSSASHLCGSPDNSSLADSFTYSNASYGYIICEYNPYVNLEAVGSSSAAQFMYVSLECTADKFMTGLCLTENNINPCGENVVYCVGINGLQSSTSNTQNYNANVNYLSSSLLPPPSPLGKITEFFLKETNSENSNHIALCDNGYAITAICGTPFLENSSLSLPCPSDYNGPTYISCQSFFAITATPTLAPTVAPTATPSQFARRTILADNSTIGTNPSTTGIAHNMSCNSNELMVGICIMYLEGDDNDFVTYPCGGIQGPIIPQYSGLYVGFIICEQNSFVDVNSITSVTNTQSNYTYLECAQSKTFMSGLCILEIGSVTSPCENGNNTGYCSAIPSLNYNTTSSLDYVSNTNYATDYWPLPNLPNDNQHTRAIYLNETDSGDNHIAVCDPGYAITAICGVPESFNNTANTTLCPSNYTGPTYIICQAYTVTTLSPTVSPTTLAPTTTPTAVPTMLPTAIPTAFPTVPRTSPHQCWTANDISDTQCRTNDISNTWCYPAQDSFWYKIGAESSIAYQRALNIDIFEELDSIQQEFVQNITKKHLANLDTGATCWSSRKQKFWLPFDLIQNVSNYTTITNNSWRTSPFSRNFLAAGIDTGLSSEDVFFLQTIQQSSSAGYVFTHESGTGFVENPFDFRLEPSSCDGDQIALQSELEIPELFITACQFVCIQIFYGGNVDWAPNSVGWHKNIVSEKECYGYDYTWTNLRSLRPMLLLNAYQRYADTANLTSMRIQQTPWENFSAPAGILPSSNCKIVATQFCGVYHSGFRDANEDNGSMPRLTEYTYPIVVPDVWFYRLNGSLANFTDDERNNATIIRLYRSIVWRVMLKFDRDTCEQNKPYEMEFGPDLLARVNLQWYNLSEHTEGCVGMPGCDDFSSDVASCNAAPGCIFIGNITFSPTTLAPFGLQSLAPIAAPPSKGVFGETDMETVNRESALAVIYVAVFLVFALVGIGFAWRECGDVKSTSDANDMFESEPYETFALG